MKALTKLGFIQNGKLYEYSFDNGGFLVVVSTTGNIYYRDGHSDILEPLSVFHSISQIENLLKALQ